MSFHAFTDEYGDTSLAVEKDGVTDFFIVTAILIDDTVLSAQRLRVDAIRSRFFGTGEMKSCSISSNDIRRLSILRELSILDIRTYSLVIDKRELDRESGLAYRRSFFKFLNRRLYEHIFCLLSDVRLVADEHGREQFMKGFIAYIDRELPLTLFDRRDFSFERSENEVMLQVADLVSGSLARVVDPGKKSASAPEMLSLILRRSVGIEVWPPRPLPDPHLILGKSAQAQHDEIVRRHCIRQAQLFMAKHSCDVTDEDLRIQTKVLEILLFGVQFGDAREYISSVQIIERLRIVTGLFISERRLRSAVSGLRDAGVVIGTSQKGYKIPVSEVDVAEYAAHANTIVPPMLARLQRARHDLMVASLGRIDILASENFENLQTLVDALSNTPFDFPGTTSDGARATAELQP